MTDLEQAAQKMDDRAKQRFLSRLADFIGEPPLTKEETDEWLRSAGYDPEKVGKRIRACVEAALAEYAAEKQDNEAE